MIETFYYFMTSTLTNLLSPSLAHSIEWILLPVQTHGNQSEINTKEYKV